MNRAIRGRPIPGLPAAAFAAAILVAGLALSMTRGMTAAAPWALACISVFLTASLVGLRSELHWRDPLFVVGAFFLLYFLVGPTWRWIEGRPFFATLHAGRAYGPGFLALAAVWAGILGGFTVTFVAKPVPAPIRPTGKSLQALSALRRWGLALFLMGMLAIALTLMRGGPKPGLLGVLPYSFELSPHFGEGLGGYLMMMVDIWIVSFLCLLRGNQWRLSLSQIALLGIAVGVYMSYGFRYRFAALLVALPVILGAQPPAGRRLRSLAPWALLLFLAGFGAILGAIRGAVRQGDWEGSRQFTYRSAGESLVAETATTETFFMVLESVPERIPFAGLREPIMVALTMPIPRAVWPQKPDPDYLRIIAQAVGGTGAEDAGLAVPAFGEWYMMGGWPAMMLGSVLVGVGLALLRRWYCRRQGDPWSDVLFSVWLTFVVVFFHRGYLAQQLMIFAFLVGPALAGATLGRRHSVARRSVGMTLPQGRAVCHEDPMPRWECKKD
jgi:hypothetical protein